MIVWIGAVLPGVIRGKKKKKTKGGSLGLTFFEWGILTQRFMTFPSKAVHIFLFYIKLGKILKYICKCTSCLVYNRICSGQGFCSSYRTSALFQAYNRKHRNALRRKPGHKSLLVVLFVCCLDFSIYTRRRIRSKANSKGIFHNMDYVH